MSQKESVRKGNLSRGKLWNFQHSILSSVSFRRTVDIALNVGFWWSWCHWKACATFSLKVLDLRRGELGFERYDPANRGCWSASLDEGSFFDRDSGLTRCHNPIFTHRIFSGVGTQNETARTEPAQSDEGPPHQITSKHGPGHISQNSGSFDQGWPSVDQGLTELFLIRLGSTTPRNPQNVVRDTFPRVWRALTKFDQVWPRLTKFDQCLTGPLTRLKAESNRPLLDHSEEHDEIFDSALYGPKTDEKRGSYDQNCEKTV